MDLKKRTIETPEAKPHTIKKFELIEAYVKTWAQKLLNYRNCDGIVFIDCMSNSGVYQDIEDNEVLGTPIRIARYLSTIMQEYPSKKAWLYFNDWSDGKIEVLKARLPQNTSNFTITTSCGDGNDLLKTIAANRSKHPDANYLVVYDPYTASLDWEALTPFFRDIWGEVILNHMVDADSIRGVSQAKNKTAIDKYEKTYLTSIANLRLLGSNRVAYEQRIWEIIKSLKGPVNRKYFIASFPFFNRKNTRVYSLIHCSSNPEGFKLYKKTAWDTFGGKSSAKDTHGMESLLALDFDEGGLKSQTDEYCYFVKDIATHLCDVFNGRKDVTLEEIWNVLDNHPVFPSDGYKDKVKRELRSFHNVKISKQSMTFPERRK